MNQTEKIKQYVDNLSADATNFALKQLLAFPKSRDFFNNCIEEHTKAFNFPLEGDNND